VPQPSRIACGARKKAKIEDRSKDGKNGDKIWLNNKYVVRPNYPTSYGILFYCRDSVVNDRNNKIVNSDEELDGMHPTAQQVQFRYLLGLIPQGNSWTVFKGLPENDERPEETAIREFEEESSLDFPYNKDDWNNCPIRSVLYGITSTKKLLHIFLIPSPPELNISKFNVDRVVKIDSGKFSGLPEIIDIKYLTKKEAIQGIRSRGRTKAAKIYKSQVSILERADAILQNKT